MKQPDTTRHSGDDTFANAARERGGGLVWEAWQFLMTNKKWWLAPVFLVMLLLGLLALVGGTAAAPFIYTLF
jgi:hypothetical protein